MLENGRNEYILEMKKTKILMRKKVRLVGLIELISIIRFLLKKIYKNK